MNTIRNCCGCLFLLIVLILALLISLIWLVITARPAHAQGANIPCANQPIAESIAITPAIPLPTPLPSVRGAFFTKQLTVTLRGDECVAFAASPNGHEWMWVDDAVAIRVSRADGTTAHWSHDFRAADRTQVVSTSAQDVSALFARGENHVSVILQDLSPNVYGSSALWLVVFASPLPTTTIPATAPIPMATIIPQNPQTATPTVTLTIGLTSPSPLPTASARGGITPAPFDPTPIILAIVIGGGLGALILALTLVRRPSRSETKRVAPVHPGTLYLLDEKTFEAVTIELADWESRFVVLSDPFRVEPVRQGQVPLMRVAPCAEGIRLYADGSTGDDPMLLRYGDSTNIGTVKLTLENNSGWSAN